VVAVVVGVAASEHELKRSGGCRLDIKATSVRHYVLWFTGRR